MANPSLICCTIAFRSVAGGGYEFLIKSDLPGQADRIAAEAIEHSKAKPFGQGVKDLVLLPSHLALTIHEIVRTRPSSIASPATKPTMPARASSRSPTSAN